VKNLSDIERMLTEIERIMRRYPDDRAGRGAGGHNGW